ncbi:MAG: hypothetical protein HQL25_02780 [Candidatus Omnitrophica bacterium]|nr:hypothetical protein [Candidatus Omnitrophota bacterium]
MENRGFSGALIVRPAYLPVVMLLIGTICFWIELFFMPSEYGRTTWLAWFFFLIYSGFSFITHRQGIKESWFWGIEQFKNCSKFVKYFFWVMIFSALLILVVAFKQALLPPHLPQEYDVINYHLTLPRQHLIRHSFSHISWSVADLYYAPLDIALAPYWLSTFLPNKLPQYMFIFGLLTVAGSIVYRSTKKNFEAIVLTIAALLGSHGLCIQFGTAMLDVVMLYLVLVAIDSLLSGKYIFAALAFTFYLWSKTFIPIQCIAVALIFLILKYFLEWFGKVEVIWDRGGNLSWKILLKWMTGLMVLSIFIGGPFIYKSIYYTGTPAYPFFTGMVHNSHYQQDQMKWLGVIKKSKELLNIKDMYGKGRGGREFFEQFWVLAVPEKGVNNRFDYPLGLPYLLALLPFFYLFYKQIQIGKIEAVYLFIIIFWVIWWLGSQQSRFLFVPLGLILIRIYSLPLMRKKMVFIALTIAIFLCTLSIVRDNRRDIFKSGLEVLSQKDRELMRISATLDKSKTVKLDFLEIAFAGFPVDVDKKDSLFVFNSSNF